MRESAAISRDRNDYYAIRGQIAWRDSITADDIIAASEHAFSGRLSIEETDKGYRLNYCAGQYMPTEYRKAACAVLASAWWNTTREDCPIEYESNQTFEDSPGGWMSKQAKQTFGRGLQSKYFR